MNDLKSRPDAAPLLAELAAAGKRKDQAAQDAISRLPNTPNAPGSTSPCGNCPAGTVCCQFGNVVGGQLRCVPLNQCRP